MSDEPRRLNGPAEPACDTAPVAGSYPARSDPTGEGTHLQMTCPDATPGRFETQQIHRDRGAAGNGIASSRSTELLPMARASAAYAFPFSRSATSASTMLSRGVSAGVEA
jgi:hypothetical protein